MQTNISNQEANASATPILQEYVREPEVEKVLADNPRKTVLLLLQGAVDKATLAKVCHDANSLVEKGFHLGRLTTILDALRDRLYLSEEMPISYDLEALYRYADQAAQDAVYENGTNNIDSIIEVMSEIRNAWQGILIANGDFTQA